MIKNKKIKKGGKNCCDDIISYINLTWPIQKTLDLFFTPINYLIKIIVNVIKVVIEHWNKQIYTLSFILERFVNLFIYMLNGYINVLSLILSEIKVILKFSLLALKYNPFVIASTLLIPIINEFVLFFNNSFTIDIFTDLFEFKTKRLINLFSGSYALLKGKTVKPKCDINDYSSYEEMKENCHEQYIPRCSLNLSTIWNISFYLVILIYISAWYSFLKIFYQDSSNINFVDYIFYKFNMIDTNDLSNLKTEISTNLKTKYNI